jgi:hypothetical protein
MQSVCYAQDVVVRWKGGRSYDQRRRGDLAHYAGLSPLPAFPSFRTFYEPADRNIADASNEDAVPVTQLRKASGVSGRLNK